MQGEILVRVCCEVYGNESIPPLSPLYFSIHFLVFYTIAGYSSVRLIVNHRASMGVLLQLDMLRGPAHGGSCWSDCT